MLKKYFEASKDVTNLRHNIGLFINVNASKVRFYK